MSDDFIQQIRSYLEDKYGVDLSDINYKERTFGLLGVHEYMTEMFSDVKGLRWREKVSTLIKNAWDSVIGSFSIPRFIPYRKCVTNYKINLVALSLPLSLTMSPPYSIYPAIAGFCGILSKNSLSVHEFTHATVYKKVARKNKSTSKGFFENLSDLFFSEALALHEQFECAHLSRGDKMALGFIYIPYITFMYPLCRKWFRLFDIIEEEDFDKKCKKLGKVKERIKKGKKHFVLNLSKDEKEELLKIWESLKEMTPAEMLDSYDDLKKIKTYL